MALSKQISPTNTLVTFCLWAQRNGYAVGEMYGFSTVHPVHAQGSWHYDKSGGFGKAADINKNGSSERSELIRALGVAQELGLAVIYAKDGTNGVAAQHTTHLHTDVGEYSNTGRGLFKASGGGDRITRELQAAVHTANDEVWGPDTDKRLEAVRAASVWAGHTFPFGVKFAQSAVGTNQDGDWGSNSGHAHDNTVSAIQRSLGVRDDSVWGPDTDGAYQAAKSIRKR